MSEPAAKKRPFTWSRPTGPFDDPFAWLSDRDDPDTIAYLEAENSYADSWFARHDDMLDAIFSEIRSRVQETDMSAPVPHGPWWYVARTEEGKSYPIHCRGSSAGSADEFVLLDQNVEAAADEFFDLGVFEISQDHRLIAWSADTRGDEHYTMRVRDVSGSEPVDLVDEIRDTTWAGAAWSSDARYLFYVTADAMERPCHVWRHQIGTAQTDDVLIFSEPDERFFVGVGSTRSNEWIVVQLNSKQSSEARPGLQGAKATRPVPKGYARRWMRR